MTATKLLIAGFWAPGADADGFLYPPVEHFVVPGWYQHHSQELNDVLDYLARGRLHTAHKSTHYCKLCGAGIGNRDMTDGIWLWPEGLTHYITAHDVRLPPRFVQYIQKMLRVITDATMLPSVLEQKHKNPNGVAHTAVALIDQLLKSCNAPDYDSFNQAYTLLKSLSGEYEQGVIDHVELRLRLAQPSS